ncbi:VanZ family protein [Micropruina sonneratiae]|uniref:VanZ family protein n=1 Tax=Micropruina sonneratiae TaxID=2986940 RepID=UPI002225CC0B|nr:VanZ family protein [Micropruina sp. KQZ13P-5]MCW3156596.1 VanZ family protein [Micropruina sp. KQZ13P-5]
MLSPFGPSTLTALVLGGLLAIVAFVPVAAARYRRAGRFRPADMAMLLAVAVYAVAMWSYTLVPIPENDGFRCVGHNLHPLAFLADIAAGGRNLLHNRAFLQVALNVVLFVPLGVFLRLLLGRGIVVAALVGLGGSALIEFTQLTGVWGLYHCAYRVFDVDDMLVNTTGALLGSVLAIPLQRLSSRRRPPPRTTRVTLGRRLIGLLADLLVIGTVGGVLTIAWRVVALYLLQWPTEQLPQWVDIVLSTGVPLLVEGWSVLARGRTIGETMVGLEPRARPGAETRSRVLKLLAGVGGYVVLSLPVPYFGALSVVFGALTVGWAIWSRDHRGLSHAVAGMELAIEPPAADPPQVTAE